LTYLTPLFSSLPPERFPQSNSPRSVFPFSPSSRCCCSLWSFPALASFPLLHQVDSREEERAVLFRPTPFFNTPTDPETESIGFPFTTTSSLPLTADFFDFSPSADVNRRLLRDVESLLVDQIHPADASAPFFPSCVLVPSNSLPNNGFSLCDLPPFTRMAKHIIPFPQPYSAVRNFCLSKHLLTP